MATWVERIIFLFVLVAAAASSGGCGSTSVSCTANLVRALVVHVEDANTSAAICDATVTSNDGSQTETLICNENPSVCECRGPWEQLGTFQVTVTKPGYKQAETTVVVDKRDECHVITKDVTVKLSPL